MRVADTGSRGSAPASVECSVDGGDRAQIGAIPQDGILELDPGRAAIVSLFVDDLARSHAPTAEDSTPSL